MCESQSFTAHLSHLCGAGPDLGTACAHVFSVVISARKREKIFWSRDGEVTLRLWRRWPVIGAGLPDSARRLRRQVHCATIPCRHEWLGAMGRGHFLGETCPRRRMSHAETSIGRRYLHISIYSPLSTVAAAPAGPIPMHRLWRSIASPQPVMRT